MLGHLCSLTAWGLRGARSTMVRPCAWNRDGRSIALALEDTGQTPGNMCASDCVIRCTTLIALPCRGCAPV